MPNDPYLLDDSLTAGHLTHDYGEWPEFCSQCRPLPLFCCDEPLIDLKESKWVSQISSVAGIRLGSDTWWRCFQCPACGRGWIDYHDHDTGSGNDCEWMPQQIDAPDTACTLLYQRPRVMHRTEDTEYGCQRPEAG